MAVNVCTVTHLAAATEPQTLPKEAVRRKWVKIKVTHVPNRNGDQRDEGRTGRKTDSFYILADTSCPDNLNCLTPASFRIGFVTGDCCANVSGRSSTKTDAYNILGRFEVRRNTLRTEPELQQDGTAPPIGDPL